MQVNAKHILAIVITFLYGNNGLYSQNLEQIHLKDGSVIEGYICEQIPGKSVTVQGYKATITVGADSLISSSETIIPVSSLSTEWKSWLMGQNVTPDAIKLSTLKFPNTEYKDVRVIEKGDAIKFLSLTPCKYILNWNKLEKTTKTKRSANQYSGLNDIIDMKDGTRYEGQVIEQVPGKTVKISISENNDIMVNASLIDEMHLSAISNNISTIEQSPLLDRIFIKGIQWPVEGLITDRKMGKSISILTIDNRNASYPIKNISKYQKFINPNYKVLTEKPIDKGTILINGSERNAWFAPLEIVNGYYVLGKYSSMVSKVGQEIVFEANLDDPLVEICVIKAYRKDISESTAQSLERVVFTQADLKEISLPVNKEITVDGYIKLSFIPHEEGDYIIYVDGKDGYIIISVD